MFKKYSFVPAIVLVSVLASCSSDTPNKETLTAADSASSAVIDSAVNTIAVPRAEMVISDIPFPFEILENLHAAGVAYDPKALNPVSNTPKYSQYNSKALNLGIYGADLAYVVTNEKFLQVGDYVKNAKELAEDLNIAFAFNQEMLNKYSKFKDNKDSLTKAVYDSYSQVDKTLKGDERVGIAALVVTGSWLEGLYLSTKTFTNAPKTERNEGLYKTIGGQKQSLRIVVKLLEEYKSDPYIAALIADLKDITSVYDNVSASEEMNERQLAIVHQKVEKLRKRIIDGL